MISLADIRDRNVAPTWQEAVAVVQELIQAVAAAHGSLDRLPDLEHVALIPNGDVVALPGSASAEQPVRHLGLMLGLLLEGSNAPGELTTFVERSTATPPQFDSAEEFSRALAFFERPGRRQDVERLVSRTMAAEAQTRADDELRRLKERTANTAERTPLEDTVMMERPRQRSRLPIALAAVVAIMGIAGAVWYRANTMRQEREAAEQAQATAQPAADEASAAAGESSPAAESQPAGTATTPSAGQTPTGQAPANGQKPAEPPSLMARAAGALKSAVDSVLGPAKEVKPAPTPEPPAAEPAKPRAKKPRQRSAPATPVGAPPAVASTPSASTATPELKSVTMEPADDVAPSSVAAITSAVPAVYSSADAAVVPPVMIRPVLPAAPPPGIPPDEVGTLDLVIDETGRVSQVKLRSPMNRYQDRMLVAHAKSWIFKPALRDGQPVKYRTRVRVTI